MATAFPSHGTTNWDTPLKAYIGARTPVNVAEDYGTSSAQVLAAAAAAKAAGRGLYFAPGAYAITGDLVVDWDDACLVGPDGTAAVLNFTSGGLVIDGSSTWRFRTTLSNLTINRAGTAGPAWDLKGGGASKGATRGHFSNIRVESSTGDALKVDGSYTHTFVGCYLRGASAKGLNVVADPIAGTVFGNALTFVGGEIQGNAKAVELTSSQCVTFVGTAIEGNTQGVELIDNARNTMFLNCYIEANGAGVNDYDLKVGTTTSCTGLVVKGGFWNDASIGKGRSINLIRAIGVEIDEVQFAGFGTNSPVSVNEASGGAVLGEAGRNCATNGSAAVVNLNGATQFNRSTLGQNPSAPILKHLKASATLDFPSIAVQSSANLTMTVTGAAVGDDCFVTLNGTPAAGLDYIAWVSATDTVTVRAMNVSSAAVDAAAATFRVHVWN